MSNTGKLLQESNEEIIKYIRQLRDQRNELGFLVEKQKKEKINLEAELARISYKLGLINKSLSQRSQALKLYDATILEIEDKYKGLADSTQGFLTHVRNETSYLENSIDKRIGTEDDCSDCPTCDTTTQNQTQRRHRGVSDEFPTKQTYEYEKNKTESLLSDKPIYSWAMEYPMMLSPMIKKEHTERLKEKATLIKINPQLVNNPLTQDVLVVGNESLSQKDITRQTPSESTIETENGELEDMHPCRDTAAKCSPAPKESKSKDVKLSETPSLIDYPDREEEEKLTVNEYEEVIPDAESRAWTEKNTLNNWKANSRSVETFGQAYRLQHECKEQPSSLARSKKPILNKKDQSLFFTEDNSQSSMSNDNI